MSKRNDNEEKCEKTYNKNKKIVLSKHKNELIVSKFLFNINTKR